MNNVSEMLPLVIRCQDYEYKKKEALFHEQIIPPGIPGCYAEEIQTPEKESEEGTQPAAE